MMLTTSINPADKEKSANYTCLDGFLSKPLEEGELIKILNNLLEETTI
jgi:hypothetical protein